MMFPAINFYLVRGFPCLPRLRPEGSRRSGSWNWPGPGQRATCPEQFGFGTLSEMAQTCNANMMHIYIFNIDKIYSIYCLVLIYIYLECSLMRKPRPKTNVGPLNASGPPT